MGWGGGGGVGLGWGRVWGERRGEVGRSGVIMKSGGVSCG